MDSGWSKSERHFAGSVYDSAWPLPHFENRDDRGDLAAGAAFGRCAAECGDAHPHILTSFFEAVMLRGF